MSDNVMAQASPNSAPNRVDSARTSDNMDMDRSAIGVTAPTIVDNVQAEGAAPEAAEIQSGGEVSKVPAPVACQGEQGMDVSPQGVEAEQSQGPVTDNPPGCSL